MQKVSVYGKCKRIYERDQICLYSIESLRLSFGPAHVTYKRVLVRRGKRKDYVNELCPQRIFKIGGEKHR